MRFRSASAAGAAMLLAGLTWGTLSVYSLFFCMLGGVRGSVGVAAWLACLPAVVLCGQGLLIWRRSPVAVLIAPIPLLLWVSVGFAGSVAPTVFELSACSLRWGLGRVPFSMVPLLAGVFVPLFGLLALAHSDPEAASRGGELALAGWRAVARPKVSLWVLGLAMAGSAAMFVFALLRPISIEDQWPMKTVATVPAAGSWDLPARLSLLRVRSSRLPGADSGRSLGSALEQRIGPVSWTWRTAGPWRRVITATGHFPPAAYRPLYEKRLQAFQNCVLDTSGVRAHEKFVEQWSSQALGVLAPAEIAWAGSVFRRAGFAIPERYERQPMQMCWQARDEEGLARLLPVWRQQTADLLRPGEWNRLAGLFSRNHMSVLSLTCFYLWTSTHLSQTPQGETECPRLNPGSPEEFSRIVLEWDCVGIRCQWDWHEPDSWQRIAPSPCRGDEHPFCWQEWYHYLLTGRLNSEP